VRVRLSAVRLALPAAGSGKTTAVDPDDAQITEGTS